MAKKKMVKTNAVRLLESEGIAFETIEYDVDDGQLDGVSVAEKTGQPADRVYKTLVTIAAPQALFVFIIPVAQELDLKKAAKAVSVKNLDMLPLKDLTKETGYVRGGCTAIGMKKPFPVVIDQSAERLPEFVVSAGKPGLQMKLAPADLARLSGASFAPLVKN
ncbi:Cys-tRNA(Pro)/Cys-tRNA(Cys) deacylase [Sporosarcina luteola]|nr:Cys-tRNA(Pro)/Cys-tRNA(Cys) deacylase [Sporosarcina luteola]